MKALICSKLNDLDAITIEEIDKPSPGTGQVLVKIAAASVNFPDLLVSQGQYQADMAPPIILGSGGAGIVAAVGEGVDTFRPGDRVVGVTLTGAFAEYLACNEDQLFKLPEGFPLEMAASYAITYGTVFQGLVRQANIKRDDWVLVLGASGGIGMAAIDIAKAFGARVIAAASSADKLTAARSAGADHVIDYSACDLKAEVRSIVGSYGVDIVVDPVGDRFADPAMRVLAWEGRYLVIGFAGGEIPKLQANLLLLKKASAIGVIFGEQARRDYPTLERNFGEICAMFKDGRLKGHLQTRYELARAPEAIRQLALRSVIGKIIIEIDPALLGE